jgi:hypothetical protein
LTLTQGTEIYVRNMNQIVPDIRDRVGEPYAATAEGQDCCSTSSTTITQAFLEITYNTMDCGGVADKWEETAIQLWNPGTSQSGST